LRPLRYFLPFTAIVLGLLVLGAACSRSPERTEASAIKVEGDRQQAPDFSLTDATGKTVTLSDFKGKVVLLNFWATWCSPCRIEIPWFVEFQRAYRDQGFEVMGVSMDEEGWEVIKPFLDRMEVNYRILLGDDMVAQQYGGVEALPTTFLIDRQGRIASTHVGLVSKDVYEKDIKELLEAPASSAAHRNQPGDGRLVAGASQLDRQSHAAR
jgi:peroxiredoxin